MSHSTKTLIKRKAREKTFCQEYSIDQNGTRSAKAAGYAPKSAHVTASLLLKKPKIRAAIDAILKKRADKLEVTGEGVLGELKTIGFAPSVEVQPKNVDKLRALELIGKHLRLFRDILEVQDTTPLLIEQLKEADKREAQGTD